MGGLPASAQEGEGFAFCNVAPTKRCAGGLPTWITPSSPAPQERQVCDGFESGCPSPDAVAPGGLAKSARPLCGRWLVRRVAAFVAYATPFDLPSFGRGAISERESTERGTISESDVKVRV
jgi:hypothetical protein